MKKLLMLAVLAGLSQASAQNYVEEIKIDPVKQTATTSLVHDFGFPTGRKLGIYTLACPAGVLNAQSFVEEEDFSFSDEPPKVDESVTAKFKQANLINAKPPYALFRTDDGTYKVLCRNGALVSDFSEQAKANKVLSVKGSNVSFGPNVFYSGLISLTVPALDDNLELVFLGDFPGLDKVKTFTIGTAGVFMAHLLADTEGSALFHYQASNNTLVPLQYDGAVGKAEDVKSIAIPADRMITFYYAPDYNKDAGWTKIVVDLKNFQTWNLPATKPKGAKIKS